MKSLKNTVFKAFLKNLTTIYLRSGSASIVELFQKKMSTHVPNILFCQLPKYLLSSMVLHGSGVEISLYFIYLEIHYHDTRTHTLVDLPYFF